LTSVW